MLNTNKRKGITLAEITVSLALIAVMITLTVSFVVMLTDRVRVNCSHGIMLGDVNIKGEAKLYTFVSETEARYHMNLGGEYVEVASVNSMMAAENCIHSIDGMKYFHSGVFVKSGESVNSFAFSGYASKVTIKKSSGYVLGYMYSLDKNQCNSEHTLLPEWGRSGSYYLTHRYNLSR